MPKLFYPLLALLILMGLSACDMGQKLDNQAPETQIFLDEINLEGENRLRSTIRLHWIGEDVDGYVVGYEVSLDQNDWTFTTRTDSILNFALPPGRDTIDLSFFVRAKDNEGALDPSPDELVIPLKNTPPIALFDTLSPLQDTFYTVFALPVLVDDPDGSNTIDSVLIKANEGPWLAVNPSTKIVTVLPTSPEATGAMNGTVFEDLDPSAFGELEGIRLEDDNIFYIKSVDIAGSSSKIDTSQRIFLKRKTGNLLVLDDHQNDDVDTIYSNRLRDIYPNFDQVNMALNRPKLWNPTFRVWISLYDKILWYGDGRFASGTESLLIELAANEIQNFLSGGGKLLFSTTFTSQFNQRLNLELSPLFEFTPMDSLANNLGRQPRLSPDSLIRPKAAFASELEALQSSFFAAAVYPYYPKNPDNTLFTADVSGVGGAWQGPTDMIGRTVFINGETNVVFSSIELHTLSRNSPALNTFLDVVLNQYFNW